MALILIHIISLPISNHMFESQFSGLKELVKGFIKEAARENAPILKESEKKSVTLSTAIEIGKKELIKIDPLSWDKELSVKADDDNTVWNSHIKSSPSVLKNENVKKMQLGKKNYWAIYYVPKNYSGKGGDGFVFIDRSDGKVIGRLLGE